MNFGGIFLPWSPFLFLFHIKIATSITDMMTKITAAAPTITLIELEFQSAKPKN